MPVRHTDINGVQTDYVVDLQDGYVVTRAEGVVVDADASTFTLAISGPSEVIDGPIASLFNVFIGADGTIGATESLALEVEEFEDEKTGDPIFQQDFFAPLDVQQLGGGVVAFNSPNGNAGSM